MKVVDCVSCGSGQVREAGGRVVCAYCGSRFVLDGATLRNKVSVIDVHSDIEVLLQKCVDDPSNQRRYAHLVLDLDPTNERALRFLN